MGDETPATTGPNGLPVCPSWCTLPADHLASPDEQEGRVHRGPDHGVISIDWDDYEGAPADQRYSYDVTGSEHLPAAGTASRVVADLRRLAADAVRAADWLEQVAR